MFLFLVVSTSTPQNEAELQLYRVLQRASLLAYYDTLLEMGTNRSIIFHSFNDNEHEIYWNESNFQVVTMYSSYVMRVKMNFWK